MIKATAYMIVALVVKSLQLVHGPAAVGCLMLAVGGCFSLLLDCLLSVAVVQVVQGGAIPIQRIESS